MAIDETLDDEISLINLLRSVFARADWTIPFIEAQSEYRNAYYGLSAAALLEDVFYDAVANYVRRFHPVMRFEQSVRGAAGDVGDYTIGGLSVSHKVLKGLADIAVHWDATISVEESWSSNTPMIVVLSEFSTVTGKVVSNLGESRTKFRAGVPVPMKISASQRWTVVHWPLKGGCRRLREIEGPPFVWHEVWPKLG